MSPRPDSRPTPRRVFITGIGVITAIGTGLPAFRAGLRAGRSPVKRIDRFDPSGVPLAGRRPGGRLRAARPWMPRAGAALDRFSQFGLVTGRMAMDDAGIVPGSGAARRIRRAHRDLPRVGAGRHRVRREPARALPRPRAARRLPHPRARRVRRRGAGEPRASRWTSAARSSRPPTRARRGRWRSARRSRRSARARSTPPSPAACEVPAVARSRSGRSTSSGRSRPATTTTRRTPPGRSTRAATGSSWARAPRSSSSRRASVALARGATPYAEVLGYGATSDAHHMVQPRADGRRGGPRGHDRPRGRRRGGADEIDWVSAHASSTPIGDIAEARAIALALGDRCGDRPGERDQGPDRAPARRDRRDRGRRWAPSRSATAGCRGPCNLVGPGARARRAAARPAPRRPDGRYERVLSTSFGFGGLNAALVLGAP